MVYAALKRNDNLSVSECIIRIKNLPGGKVSIEATPNFETMMKMDESGYGLTAAHGYALSALNHMRSVSKSNDPTNRLILPSIGH